MTIRAIITLIYGGLIAGGGVMGYVIAKSLPSIISGMAFGVLAIIGGILMLGNHTGGLVLTYIAVIVVGVFFAIQFLFRMASGKPVGRALSILILSIFEILALLIIKA